MVKTEDGSRHEGHFRDGIPSGFGIRALRDGRRVMEGGGRRYQRRERGSYVSRWAGIYRRTPGFVTPWTWANGLEGRMFPCRDMDSGESRRRFLSAVQIGEKESFFGDYKEGELVEGTGIQMNSDGTFFAGAVVKRVRHGTGYDFDRECKHSQRRPLGARKAGARRTSRQKHSRPLT
jgi:hypothetical protein